MNFINVYKKRIVLTGTLLFLLGALILGCSGINVTKYYENGAIASSAPIATNIGCDIFRRGGNAFDAAIAVGLTLAVVHPEAGNIGGGGFALIRDGKTKEVRALDFREKAPMSAYQNMFLDKDSNVIDDLSTLGALACGVPGTIAGLYELWKSYGTIPWVDLAGLAASLADTGFIVDQKLVESFEKNRKALAIYDETSDIFLPGGSTPQAGERFIQKDLAKTLQNIAANGPDGFYKGETAELIDSCMKKYGGIITKNDLESYYVVWRNPIVFNFDSLLIYSMPPPSSGGILLGQILKLIEPYDFSRYTSQSPEFIHLFCEMSRLAFADRSEFFGDPDYYAIPPGLLDSVYLEKRRSLFDPEHARLSELTLPGIIPTESEETTHFSVCDNQGNMVSITYTINASFGSKLVVHGAGFLLNNEMDDFSVKPGVPNIFGLVGGEANKIEPGKRMLSSMSPTLVLKKGKPYLALGAPGGSKIITVVAQAIINFTRFGLSPYETVAHPRFHHQWLPDTLYLEEGSFDINVLQTLIRYGHNIKERDHYSDLQLIYINEDNGLMSPVSDPRKRGYSSGY
ncbi:MAG: gamma-glutamyltransferase [bacterium]